ncbi:MAG: Gfo/Idh/MocA family oxidoreductase [Ruminococcaceae bacterium]|nr:Gfo/Idh/MocA family oxidoreductase [Oscillospiraceae bacterium]
MKKPIRLGTIGLGRAGYSMHLKELKGKEDMFTFAAVCDLEEDRRENMKNLYGCKTYVNAEDLVEDPDVDVVVVATRSCDHFRHAKTALEAGKIVFLEKPICTNYADAKALMELDAKNGEQKLFIRHNRRFEAKFMQLNKIIDSGILGDVYLVRRNTSNYELRHDWQTLSQYGGGQLLNWGPHIVDQALRFCGGDYKSLHSITRQIAASGDCEDYVRAVFTGINDRIVEIEIGGGTALRMPEYIVYGTRGALVDKGATYTIKHLPADYEIPHPVSSAHTPKDAKFGPAIQLPFVTEELTWDTNDLDHTWVYLYETLCEGKPYPIKNEEALMVMKAIQEIKDQNA